MSVRLEKGPTTNINQIFTLDNIITYIRFYHNIDLGHFNDSRDLDLIKIGLSGARKAVKNNSNLKHSFEVFPGPLFNWTIDTFIKLYSTSMYFTFKINTCSYLFKFFYFSMLLLYTISSLFSCVWFLSNAK